MDVFAFGKSTLSREKPWYPLHYMNTCNALYGEKKKKKERKEGKE